MPGNCGSPGLVKQSLTITNIDTAPEPRLNKNVKNVRNVSLGFTVLSILLYHCVTQALERGNNILNAVA